MNTSWPGPPALRSPSPAQTTWHASIWTRLQRWPTVNLEPHCTGRCQPHWQSQKTSELYPLEPKHPQFPEFHLREHLLNYIVSVALALHLSPGKIFLNFHSPQLR